MSFCPSKDIHSVYLDGELPENYKAEYELHISHCEKCRKELEQLKAIHAMFKIDSDSLKILSQKSVMNNPAGWVLQSSTRILPR